MKVINYLKELNDKIDNNWEYLFRGQANSSWKVKSTATQRLEKNTTDIDHTVFVDYHVDLIHNARESGYGCYKGEKLGDLEILAQLQHYGGATCLVDFTKSFLVALWFACDRDIDEETKKENDGKVFIVNKTANIISKRFYKIDHEKATKENNIKDILDFKEEKNIKIDTKENKNQPIELAHSNNEIRFVSQNPCDKMWVWQSKPNNPRILQQNSVFVFSSVFDFASDIAESIIIKKEDKENLRKELKCIFDISKETMFKDFVGFSMEVNSKKQDWVETKDDKDKIVERVLKLTEEGKTEEAKSFLGEYESLNDYDFTFMQGELEYNYGFRVKSKELFEKALQLDNKTKRHKVKIYSYLAVMTFAKELTSSQITEKSVEYLEKAIEIEPKNTRTYYVLGERFHYSGMYKEALETYIRMIKNNPKETNAYFFIGFYNKYLGIKDANPLQDYRKVKEADFNYAIAQYNMGVFYSKNGEHEVALKHYINSYDKNPSDNNTILNIAQTYNYLGDYEESIKWSNQIFSNNDLTNKKEVYSVLGYSYHKLGAFPNAIKNYKIALESKHDSINYTKLNCFELIIITKNKEEWEQRELLSIKEANTYQKLMITTLEQIGLLIFERKEIKFGKINAYIKTMREDNSIEFKNNWDFTELKGLAKKETQKNKEAINKLIIKVEKAIKEK